MIRLTRGVMKICPAPPPKILALGLARRVASSRSTSACGVNAQFFENLGNHPAGLFNQRQQDMLGVNLVVTVALDNLCRTLGGFLRSLGKSVKSHHNSYSSVGTQEVSL